MCPFFKAVYPNPKQIKTPSDNSVISREPGTGPMNDVILWIMLNPPMKRPSTSMTVMNIIKARAHAPIAPPYLEIGSTILLKLELNLEKPLAREVLNADVLVLTSSF